jgi:hypothetical protein
MMWNEETVVHFKVLGPPGPVEGKTLPLPYANNFLEELREIRKIIGKYTSFLPWSSSRNTNQGC